MEKTAVNNHPAVAPDLLRRVQESIQSVIRGKDEVIQLTLVGLFARGHLLIEDVPGVGKTTLAHSLAKSFSCSFQRLQFTSDMLPSDVVGISVFSQSTQRFEFRQGPIFANIVLADEIDRTTPKTQSALLEAMNEDQVTVDNRTYPLPRPFMVVATQNPIEHHGTYPLPESQMDRFLMRIRVGYPSRESEKEILRNFADAEPLAEIEPVMSAEDVLEVQQAVRRVTVDEALMNYTRRLWRRLASTIPEPGVSRRGSMSFYRAAQPWPSWKAAMTACPMTSSAWRSRFFPSLHRSFRYLSTMKKSDQSDRSCGNCGIDFRAAVEEVGSKH